MIKCGDCKSGFSTVDDYNKHSCPGENAGFLDHLFSFNGIAVLVIIGAIIIGVLNHGKGW